jgi:hypothetical protein
MHDVVLEHVVLRFQRRKLGDQAGVARGIKDNVSDAKESKAGGRGEKQCRAGGDDPFAVVGQREFHNTS